MQFDDVVAELKKITTSVNGLKPEIEANLTKQLDNMGVNDLTVLLGGLEKCDLQICKTIKELKNITDFSDCKLDICNRVRELDALAATGDLSSCNLEICQKVKSLDSITNLETCDLDICKKIKELSSLTDLKQQFIKLVKELINMALDPLKKQLLIALTIIFVVVGGIILFMALSFFGVI